MALGSFNYRSHRAEKARLAYLFDKTWVFILTFLAIFGLLTGGYLLFLGYAAGWAVVGLSVVPAMIVEWRKGGLGEIEIDKNSNTIDGVLSADILGMLPRQPSPKDLALIIGELYGGHFFAARFGIGNGLLRDVASEERDDIETIWREAMAIRKELASEFVTSNILVASILKVHPNHEALLAHLQLDMQDILNGIRWDMDIDDMIKDSKKPKRTGGLARDWSFGYIPTLSQFGDNISRSLSVGGGHGVEVDSRLDNLKQMGQILAEGRNVAVVGKNGVGKTNLVYDLAKRLLDADGDMPKDLKFKQVFVLDASSLVSSAPGRGELEGLVVQIVNEAYRAKNVVLCFDNAELFFEEAVGSVDLTNVIMPIVKSGGLPIIFTMDEQRYLKIAQRNPQIATEMNRINLSEPIEAEVMKVLQDKLIGLEYRKKVTYMYQALKEVYRMSSRYMHDVAMPGRAVKLLELAADHADGSLVTAGSVEIAVEKTANVKVGIARKSDDRDKLLNLEDLIHQRMVNQKRAVGVIADALRRARSGVRNQERPIGTFMFLGPTGVGKTELAKALASVYFDGEENIVRLDMNEYVGSEDVSRLIADGASYSMSLTAQVMKRPFSVVLLDEIEKAHPNVLTTLLQMLDEGVLRDVNNREISFRDCIIVATSNAGADRIREHIERGLDIEKFEDQFVDELIDSGQFKPEFLNRFDEIVVFRPLKKDELLQVVDRMIEGVNKTLAQQKVSVSVSQEAKEYLVDAGYDPRLGARPMRRVVQRAVENTVAKKVLSGEVEAGGVVEISLGQVQSMVDSKKAADQIVDGGKDEASR